jgi:drug/metabolite transporter (DMT)-like permease
MPNVKFKNHLHLHFIVFIWGFTAVLGALITIGAIPLVWYRMGMTTIVLLIFALFTKRTLRQSRIAVFQFSIVGFIIAIHWICFFYAIKISNVSITLAAMSTGALFTTFLEPLFYKKRIVWYEVLFALVAMLGLLVIFKVEKGYTLGLIFGLIASFLSALFAVLNSKLIKKYKATPMTFYEVLAGFILISLILLVNGKIFEATFFKLSLTDFFYIFILASVCTAYTMVASNKLLLRMSPFTMMLTINLEPVYGILLAIVILGDSEKMAPQFYLGTTLIIISIILNAAMKLYPKILAYKKR